MPAMRPADEGLASENSTLRLIVGLGNPGERYARTRHNIGWRLLDFMAGAHAAWKDFQNLGQFMRQARLLLGRPATYMNESGRFVGALSRFYKIFPGELLVCFDDVSLPLGRLRLRAGGSSGGHKGMESIIACLGTTDIPRLRIGIGPQTPGMDSAAYVLARFTAAEEERLSVVIGDASKAVHTAVAQGLQTAMNRYNFVS